MSDTLTPIAAAPANGEPIPPSLESTAGQYAPLFTLSVERYHEMIAAGIFDGEDAKVELLEGVLVNKMSKDPIHSAVTRIVTALLTAMLPADYFISVGEPMTTADSEPEPDVSVVRGKLTDFFERHPSPAEAAQIVEVANSSLRRDRQLKRRVYANAGCAAYWIVNTIDGAVEVYGDPNPDGGYADPRVFRRGERVPVSLDGRAVGAIAVDDLFPKLD